MPLLGNAVPPALHDFRALNRPLLVLRLHTANPTLKVVASTLRAMLLWCVRLPLELPLMFERGMACPDLPNLRSVDASLGKAGRSRWLGRRPHNRGVAMNPVDHPLGGGEGKTSGGRHPVSPWGQPTKGYKTRRRKSADRFIVQRRPK